MRNNHDRLTCLFCQSIDERKGSPDKTISWTLPDKTINSSSGGSRTTGNPHPHRQRAPSTEPTQSSAVCSNNNNNPSCFVWRVFLAARVSRACLGIINRACFQRKETEKETRENGRAGGPFLDSNISFFLVSRFFSHFSCLYSPVLHQLAVAVHAVRARHRAPRCDRCEGLPVADLKACPCADHTHRESQRDRSWISFVEILLLSFTCVCLFVRFEPSLANDRVLYRHSCASNKVAGGGRVLRLA